MPAADPAIETLVAAAAAADKGLAALSAAQCAAVLGVDGLAASLLNNIGLELVWYDETDAAGLALEDLQFTLGEGFAIDTARTGESVILPDLHTAPEHRWPALLPAVHELPIRAVFALPLHLGAIRLGALTGHRSTPGPFPRPQIADALTLAEGITDILLTPEGTREIGTQTAPPLHRAQIHQAAGALTHRLGIPIDAALARLRAYAFTHDRTILDIADEVINQESDLDTPPT